MQAALQFTLCCRHRRPWLCRTGSCEQSLCSLSWQGSTEKGGRAGQKCRSWRSNWHLIARASVTHNVSVVPTPGKLKRLGPFVKQQIRDVTGEQSHNPPQEWQWPAVFWNTTGLAGSYQVASVEVSVVPTRGIKMTMWLICVCVHVLTRLSVDFSHHNIDHLGRLHWLNSDRNRWYQNNSQTV